MNPVIRSSYIHTTMAWNQGEQLDIPGRLGSQGVSPGRASSALWGPGFFLRGSEGQRSGVFVLINPPFFPSGPHYLACPRASVSRKNLRTFCPT